MLHSSHDTNRDVGTGPQIRNHELLVSCQTVSHHYLSGLKKQHLVEWWLKLIEDSTNEYLTTLGFDFEALPYDYLDTPPKEPRKVVSNLQIISSLIHPSDSRVRIGLVEHLKALVYVKINEFLRVADHVLGEADSHGDSHKSLQQDIEYLLQMKSHDDSFFREYAESSQATTRVGTVSDVVPVAGLVYSSLHRHHNELKTVREHWTRVFDNP